MKVFDYDNQVMSFFSKACDLFLLNILTIVFCIPVITIGAATTAAHYTSLKIRRNEGHVLSCFWKSFCENLKQSTIIWVIYASYCFVAFMVYNLVLRQDNVMSTCIPGIVIGMLIFATFVYVWMMPLQSRFVNPILSTFKNAFYLVCRYLLRTILMVCFNILPIGTFLFMFYVVGMKHLILWLLFGISLPIYLCAITYDKVFEQLEKRI